MELQAGGRLEVQPRATVRIVRDEPGALLLHVDEGEIALRGLDPAAHEVQVGAYTVVLEASAVTIRKTSGVPLVRVEEGAVRVQGPDLPAGGIRIVAD